MSAKSITKPPPKPKPLPKPKPKISNKPSSITQDKIDLNIANTVTAPSLNRVPDSKPIAEKIRDRNESEISYIGKTLTGTSVKHVPDSVQITDRKTDRSDSEVINTDSKGYFLKYDIREDEEQFKKLSEITDILVAAGYFRARIKGLTDFDKVVGGMCWCLEMSNLEIDCDLLFADTLTIGQKIALTEKIVTVLQIIKCPFRLEPHQIQGMDCIHIFPVIQWLVKTSIQFRQEMRQYIAQYGAQQFNKTHQLSQDTENQLLRNNEKRKFRERDKAYNPTRRYRHLHKSEIKNEKLNVKATILEYGRLKSHQDASEAKTAVTPEESDIETLMVDMTEEKALQTRISANIVGNIIGEKSDEIRLIAEAYAKQQNDFQENNYEVKEGKLRNLIVDQERYLVSADGEEDILITKMETLKDRMKVIKEKQALLLPDLASETGNVREERQAYVERLELLKEKRDEHKLISARETLRFQSELSELSRIETEDEDDQEMEAIFKTEREKLRKVKMKLSENNKIVARFQRRLDDIPSRAELGQYQKRFVELYNQVAARHNETKTFYILYNQLDDTNLHLNKEVKLLDSILSNFNQANMNTGIRDQFIVQFENILDTVRQAKEKTEKRNQIEKLKKDKLNEQYFDLVEKRRLYYKVVKTFTEECKKNELLITKYQIFK